mmetsp:Transcript_51149/g.91903  ORF Transcript_51149/g.91903 Transcript_51149/m.91903 type:complete len:132 (-) Transcript_51149:342-737(-)
MASSKVQMSSAMQPLRLTSQVSDLCVELPLLAAVLCCDAVPQGSASEGFSPGSSEAQLQLRASHLLAGCSAQRLGRGKVAAWSCAICQDAEEALNLQTLPCGHSFHKACLQQWTSSKARQSSCPLCRSPVQ